MAFDVYDRLVSRGLVTKTADNQHVLTDAGRELAEELEALGVLRTPDRAPAPDTPTVPPEPAPKVSPRQSGLVGPGRPFPSAS